MGWLFWIAGWALAADAWRRSSYQWAAADRQQGTWVALLLLLGPFTLLPYLIFALPRVVAAPASPPAKLRRG